MIVNRVNRKLLNQTLRRYNEETKFSVTPSLLSDECVSTKLGVTENFVSTLYLLIQSSTLKKCIEHCLTALATLLHVNQTLYKKGLLCLLEELRKILYA